VRGVRLSVFHHELLKQKVAVAVSASLNGEAELVAKLGLAACAVGGDVLDEGADDSRMVEIDLPGVGRVLFAFEESDGVQLLAMLAPGEREAWGSARLIERLEVIRDVRRATV
jgi:hypothetical protein